MNPEVHDSVSVETAPFTPPLILYNRVPKTGSTTFANIAYKLTAQNAFHMLHINVTYRNSHYLNVLDQVRGNKCELSLAVHVRLGELCDR